MIQETGRTENLVSNIVCKLIDEEEKDYVLEGFSFFLQLSMFDSLETINY